MSSSGFAQLRGSSIARRLAFLATDSCVYGLSAALGKILTLCTLPLLTRALSTAEFGIVDVMATFGGAFTMLVVMGQDSAIARFYCDSEDSGERKQIVAQALLTQMCVCFVVVAALLVWSGTILPEILGVPGYTTAFHVLVLSLPFAMLSSFARGLLKWTFAKWRFNILVIGTTALIVAATFVFAIQLKMGVIGVFYAQLVGMILSAVLGLVFCWKHLALPRTTEFIVPMLKFGWPYMIAGLLLALLPALDRVFVTRWFGATATGQYAVGSKLAMLLLLPVSAFEMAWGPFCFAIYQQQNAIDTFNRALRYFSAGVTLLILCLVAVSEPVITLVASSRYLEGAGVVLPLSMAVAVRAASWIAGVGIDLSKKTYLSVASLALGLGVSVLTMWLLSKPLGMTGIAWGVLVGQVVSAVTYTVFGHLVWPMKFAWQRPCVVLGGAVIAGLFMQATPHDQVWILVSVRASIILAFAAAVWSFIITPSERDLFLAAITSRGRSGFRIIRKSEDDVRRAA